MVAFQVLSPFTSCLIIVALLVLTLLLRLHTAYKAHFNLWKGQNVRELKRMPFLGLLAELFQKPVYERDLDNFVKYGSIYGFYDGFSPKIMVHDVDVIKEILLQHHEVFTDRCSVDFWDPMVSKMLVVLNGEDWKKTRAMISPSFTEKNLKLMYEAMQLCIGEMLSNLREQSSSGSVQVELKSFWGLLAINMIAKCCFGQNLNVYEENENDFLYHAKAFFSKRTLRLVLLSLLPKSVAKFLGVNLGSQKSIKYFSCLVHDILTRRRNVKSLEAENFLQQLARKVEESKKSQRTNGRIVVDDDFITAQSIMFFLAGFETTATVLTFACYELASNREVQEKLYREVKSSASSSNTIDFDSLKSLNYLNAFLTEVLRCYPPVTRIERVAGRDFVIQKCNIKIPKGCTLLYSPYCIHRNEEYFHHADQFQPERFLHSNGFVAERPRDSKLVPFGIGKRNCVAERFALLLLKLALWHLLLNYKVSMSAKTPEKLIFVSSMEMLAAKPIHVSLERRK